MPGMASPRGRAGPADLARIAYTIIGLSMVLKICATTGLRTSALAL
jgi:hypothetical protein